MIERNAALRSTKRATQDNLDKLAASMAAVRRSRVKSQPPSFSPPQDKQHMFAKTLCEEFGTWADTCDLTTESGRLS